VKRISAPLLALPLSSLLLSSLLFASPLFAQDSKPEEPLDPKDLAAEQEDVGERLKKIEDAMRRIADLMASRDPEQAARLKLAFQRSKDDRNLDTIKEIENLLKEEYFTEALEQQKNLERALERLLDILLDRDAEREDLEQRIKDLEQLSESLNRIIEEERDHYHKSDKFANPEKALQRVAAAKSKLSNLINRENKLIKGTRGEQGDPDLEGLRKRLDALRRQQAEQRGKGDAARQKQLGEEAGKLAKEIKQHAQNLPDSVKQPGPGGGNPAEQASKATSRASNSMSEAAARMQGGSKDFDADQQSAEQDLREASEALKRLADRMKRHGHQKLAGDQERIRKDTDRLKKELERLEKSAPGNDSGSGDLGKAQGQMEKAEKQLSKGERSEAVPHEEGAKQDLERAYEKLKEFEKELKRIIKLPDYDKLAKEQDDTTKKTDDLLKKMKKQGGGAPKNPDGQGKPTPGQGGVEGAKKAMDRASRDLRGNSARDANRNQKEALDRLEKAREELEEALRQMREEEQLMLLDALERRLTRMFQKQKKLFKDTIALNVRLRESKKPARADVDKGRTIGDGEAELAVDADKILELLREEGTTIVIPDVIKDLRLDLDNLAGRLRKLSTGSYTQQIQQDVIQTIKELIEVIQEERNRREGQGGGQPQEPMEGSPPPGLLPTSAELKMLRSLQLRVNKRTSQFDRMREKEEEERTRIADKQEAVGTLTRTMADKLNQEEE
jgi:hypothetical protein